MNETIHNNTIQWDYETLWPTEKVKEAGCYFYDIPIEKYISTTEVEVARYGRMTLFGGYSYLSLHMDSRISDAVKKSLDITGTGGHGARLLAGTSNIHKELERKISRFKQTEDAITFSTGYIANISTIPALVGRQDTIIADRLNHASIIDGCILSRAAFKRFRHNDMEHLEELLKQNNRGKVLVIADAVFSMDGDIFNLPVAAELCKKYGALLMIDECHALGVIGKTGKGIEEHFGLPTNTIDIKMGTLSKSIPSQGGYIAASENIIHYLKHQSRGFIYSGANAPTNDVASAVALDIIKTEPERVTKLHANIAYAKTKLQQAGIAVMDSQTAILPILCGEDWAAWEMAKYCHQEGIYIQAIPYPVVPKGQARLRLSINTDHTKEQIDKIVEVLSSARRLSS